MNWYFDTEKKREKLKKILQSWVGTPYRHRCGVKGRGVDCIHLAACVLVEAGAIARFTVPDYAPDWHLHKNAEELLYMGIKNQDAFVEVGFARPMDGDIILYQWGRASAHAALYCGGLVYQSLAGMRVEPRSWKDEHLRKKYGFRVTA